MRTVSPVLNWFFGSWARYFLDLRIVFLKKRMLEATFDQNGDGLVVLVAGDGAGEDTFGHVSGLRRGGAAAFSFRIVFTRATSRRTCAHAGGVFKLAWSPAGSAG
jgi:hypothetical protein